MRNYKYHEYIDDWFDVIRSGEVPVCKEQEQLIPFLTPILESPDTEIRGDLIYEGVNLIEKYFPFKLHDYQRFRFAIMYGLYKKDTDLPIFNENFNLWGRGCGKNGTATADSIFLVSEKNGVRNYNVDFVANSEQQAQTSFNELYDIIDNNTKLKKLFNYNKTKIKYKNTNSKVGYLTSNANTKDGGRQGCIIFDEVHQYTDYDIISVLIGGLGKVDKPRIIYLTTDGTVRDSVIDDLKERSRRVLVGEEEHNGFFPFIFKLDDPKEVDDPKNWVKAIPRLRFSETLYQQVYKEYKMMNLSADLKEKFMTKRMNLPYLALHRYVCDWDDLIACCTDDFGIDLRGVTGIGGVDFADLRDFASAGIRWTVGGMTYFVQHSWVHRSSLERTKFNINVEECVSKGWLTVVEHSDSPTISPEYIADWFEEQIQKGYNVVKIKCDSFRWTAIQEAFKRRNLPPVELIRSGSLTHNKIAPLVDLMFTNHTIKLQNDKLLRWYIWNTQRVVDKKGNVAYFKIEPVKRKTDGFMCFLHTLADEDIEESNYFPIFNPIFG